MLKGRKQKVDKEEIKRTKVTPPKKEKPAKKEKTPKKAGKGFTLKRRKKGEELTRRAKSNYLAPVAGYDFRPSLVQAGKRWGTIAKVVVKYGTNRDAQFGWMVNLIPEITVDGVKGYMFEADKPMGQSQQTELFKTQVQKAIMGLDQKNDTKSETQGDREIKNLRSFDLMEASRANNRNQIAIDSHIYILLVGDNPDSVVEQLKRLNMEYNDTMNGITLTSVAGQQEAMFKKLFQAPEGSAMDYAWMAADFAGNDHFVRKGLDDADGIAIGELTNSYASGAALMAMNRTFEKRALVAAYPESGINGYSQDLSSSSLWGQRIANTAMMEGHRVLHIVMNGFKYEGSDDSDSEFAAGSALNQELRRIDLAAGGLNPLEMFGELKDVIEIFNTNLDKLVEMFYLMSDRKVDTAMRLMLKEALLDFYITKKLWYTDAHVHPERTRVLGITRHETYPLLGEFVTSLSNIETSIKKKGGTEQELNSVKILRGTLETSLQSYRGIFNEHTTLPDPGEVKELQVYYDLSGLRNNRRILEAQFLNTFDYVAHAAKKGDIVMIHGMEKLSLGTLNVIRDRLNRVVDDGVRIAYLFDTIGSGERDKNMENLTSEARNRLEVNIFNTDGLLYQNFDQQFSYTILGTMTMDDLTQYQKKVKQRLTNNLIDVLTATNMTQQYQVRRHADLTTVMVNGDFLI